MQIQHLPAPAESPAWIITLDCGAERELTDECLVRLLENCQGTTWDDVAQRYALNGMDFGPEVLGVSKVKRDGDTVRVTLRLASPPY